MKKTILFLLLAVMSSALRAEGKFSLLTCAPGEKIYELFGHTAIRYVEGDSIDLVFNYGMFNFNSPNFIYRFVKGETDYELGIDVYRSFEYSYRRRGSAVYEQKLNLTPDETIMLLHSLLENYKPRIRKTLLRITGFHYSIINDEIAAGRIRKTDPEQLLLDIIMLNLSAFIMLPAAANVFPEIGGKRMAGILEERKKEIITLIKSRLYRGILKLSGTDWKKLPHL